MAHTSAPACLPASTTHSEQRVAGGPADKTPAEPWWRVGMVWIVIGGPLAVVLAGVVTAVIAVRGADPVLTPAERAAFAERPALQGRNHAATGEVPTRP